MRDDVTGAGTLSEVEEVIVAAVRRWLSSLQAEADTLTAALPLAADAWASILGTEIAPALGAGFMAEAARNAPDVPRQGALDILVGWPDGVDGPSTVSELLDAYPATFAGVSASQVTFILASPTWTSSFAEYMRTTVNLVSKMPDTVFVEMNTALSKTVGEGLFDRQRAVREFLSWEGEGGYVGWMRRAERIARTETATATNTAQFTAAKAKQDAGLPQKKQWNSAADERTRESHRAADGQIRDFDEPFEVGDDRLDHPGDRVHGSAKECINCRCNCTYIDAEDADVLDTAAQINNIDDLDRLIEEMEKEMGITAAGAKALAWEGRLAPVGEPTGDGRVFNEDGEFRFRSFPLPLLWQETTSDGHDSSRVVGTIDSGEITETGVMAKGVVFADEEKVLHLLDSGVIRPSVDLCDMVCELQETTDDDGAEGELLRVSSATVMAATLVAKPAFENVGVRLTGDEVEATDAAEALTASAGAPVLELTRYAADRFADPALTGPTPVTVTEDGRVFGHLALWDSCHVGMPGRCVTPPKSASGYSSFHQSTVQTEDGPLAVGRLTVGGGHADARAGVRAAAEHYDQTGATWAFARAGEDEFGIWVAGQVHAAASADQIEAGASAPLSGDWRRVGGGMELVAALSVSTPGFPVRREYTTTGGALGSLVAAAQIAPAEGKPATPVAPAGLTPEQVSALAAAVAPALAEEMENRRRRARLAAAAEVLAADARQERRDRLAAAGAVFSVDCEEGAATDDDADDEEQEDDNGVR